MGNKIEQALPVRSHDVWISSLGGVIKVASDDFEPECICDPRAHNHKIKEFLIEKVTYTPEQLFRAFEQKENVSDFLVQMTISRMCNIFRALGDAARSERPLYTKDRRLFLSDNRFTINYGGQIQDALIDFGEYCVAEREDFIQLDQNNDYDRCANKDYVKGILYYKESCIELGNKYPNHPHFGIESYNRDMLHRLSCEQKQLQAILTDDMRVVAYDYDVKKHCRYVGSLISNGIEPAVGYLIARHTHKTEPSYCQNH